MNLVESPLLRSSEDLQDFLRFRPFDPPPDENWTRKLVAYLDLTFKHFSEAALADLLDEKQSVPWEDRDWHRVSSRVLRIGHVASQQAFA